MAEYPDEVYGARHLDEVSVAELDTPTPGFDSVADAVAAIAAGEFVLVLDDEDRENEGDLIIAADKVTPEKIAYMVEYTSGVLCVALTSSDCERLQLPLMVSSKENDESMYTAFTVTVDYREGTTTGISASDRAATIAALGNPSSTADQFNRPGHIFPLRAHQGGVLVRPGHTEAAVDLAYLAGSYPAGVLCEVVDKATGEMARTEQLQLMAKEHGIKCVTIADLIRYRLKREGLARQVQSVPLQTRWGDFRAVSFEGMIDDSESIALVYGDITRGSPMVRIHQENVVGDILGVELCNSQPELDAAMRAISKHGSGVLVYFSRRSKSGSRLSAQLQYLAALQEQCDISGEAGSHPHLDVRQMGDVHSVLRSLNTSASIQLLTDNQSDVTTLQAFGYSVQCQRMVELL